MSDGGFRTAWSSLLQPWSPGVPHPGEASVREKQPTHCPFRNREPEGPYLFMGTALPGFRQADIFTIANRECWPGCRETGAPHAAHGVSLFSEVIW